MAKIKILFLAPDPSDTARLSLGQELRDIREKLQLSRQRDNFVLESREAVRPGDITQAIFDVKPQVVHFSGHGISTGELCFENGQGKMQPVQPDALADLFQLVAGQISCVVLNACYSEAQASAISEHVPFVIGIHEAIGDKTAITFASGFYKALGAGCSFEDAYKFGRVEIRLDNISQHLNPVLYTNPNVIPYDRRLDTGRHSPNTDFHQWAHWLVDTSHTEADWRFWLQWILGTVIGRFLGLLVFGSVNLSTDFPNNAGANVYIAVGAGLGLIEGLTQWFVLKRLFANVSWWIVATTLGWAVGYFSNFTLGKTIGWGVSNALFWTAVGAATGLAQWWFVLKRKNLGFSKWILATIGGAVIASFISGAIDNWLLRGLASGAIRGAITGAGLIWLLQKARLRK